MPRLARTRLICALLAVAPSDGDASQVQHFPSSDDLRTTIRYMVEDTPVPGMVLGVLEADGTTRIVTYGTAGPDARTLGPESVFEIGSITKTFTGTLLADLVARRVVSLEDPVRLHLPDSVRVPSRAEREITLLDLATHRSGLPRLASNHSPADSNDPYADYTISTMYAFLAEHELRRDPGAEYEYSNLGFQLLGHAISRASGVSLTELVRTRVIEPLGMTHTAYDLEGEVARWMAQGHRGLAVTPFNTGNEARRGAGGLRSNAVDMLEYLKANVGPAENSLEEALREAHQPRAAFGDRGARIGLAWVTTVIGGRTVIEHGGGTGGFTSRIAFDPERQVGYVLLTNSRLYSDPTANELLVSGPPLDFPEADVAAGILSELVGSYSLGPDQPVYLRLEPEGYLTLQLERRARARLSARADSSFFLKQAPVIVSPVRDRGGRVARIRYQVGAVSRTAERTDDELPEPQAVRSGAVWSSLSAEWEAARRSVAIAAGSVALLVLSLLGLEVRRRSRMPLEAKQDPS